MGPQEGRKAGVGGVKLFAGAIILMVVAAAGYALWLAGSPSAERSRRLDAQRVGDLQGIASSIDTYYSTHAAIPVSLGALQVSEAGKYYVGRTTDPVTETSYEYRTTSDTGYELCAAFDLPSEPIKPGYSSPYPYDGVEWEHGAGRDCFELDAAARQLRSACSLTSPCPAGQSCVTLGDGLGPVCVPAGMECLAANCKSGQCTIAESYPAQVRCIQ